MRCVLCGNPLSVLQKFTDEDFCCAEHRSAFLEEQQRLILERLKSSAARLAEQVRRAAQPPKPLVQEPDPAVAPFLLKHPDAHNRQWVLRCLGPADILDLPLVVPFLRLDVASGYRAELLPDLPWPRYNPGLWYCDRLEAEYTAEHFEDTIRVLASWRPLSVCWETAGAWPWRRPELRPPQKREWQGSARWDWPAGSGAVDVSAVRFEPERPAPAGLGDASRIRLPAPRLLVLRPRAIPIPADWIAAPPGAPVRPALRGRDAHQLRFFDRIYRMRPRGAVADPRVPSMAAAAAEQAIRPLLDPVFGALAHREPAGPALGGFHAGGWEPSRAGRPDDFHSIPAAAFPFTAVRAVPSLSAAQVELHPGPVDRMFRMRPRAGVADPRIGGLSGGQLEAEVFPGTPVTPSAELSGCAPVAISRFFRPRPRGPVDAERSHYRAAIPASALPSRIDVIRPEPPAAHCELAPRPTRRMFKPSPRPVSGTALAGIESGDLEWLPGQVRPASPCLSLPDCAPGELKRFFRPRPRGPVAATLPGYETIPAQFLIQSGRWEMPEPATPAGLDEDCRPRAAFRFFRPRPAGPADAPCATRQRIEPSIADFPVAVAAPDHPVRVPEPEPCRAGRFFRMRPRAGVTGPGNATAGVPVAAAEFSARPSASPACGLSDCMPLLADRLFRPRPRGPVASPAAASLERIGAEATMFPPRATKPRLTPDAPVFAVAFSQRMFRYRPRAGVDSLTGLERIACWPSIPTPRPVARTQKLGACEPVRVFRLFRPRPRAGVESGAALSRIEPAITDLRGHIAFATFGPGALGLLSPDFLNRLFRMRPKQPLEDPDTLVQTIRCKQVPPAEPEPVLATMPQEAVAQAEPSLLKRLYRMRPRAGRDVEQKARPIPAVPLAPPKAASAAGTPDSPREVLRSVSRQWKLLPLDLKAMAMLLPILFILAFQPHSRKDLNAVQAAGISSPSTTGVRQTTASGLAAAASVLKSRAATDLREDFQSGLHAWRGAAGWSDTWSYHPSGAVQPGQLALYTPSLGLSDYKMEFTAQILNRGLSWVVRAIDEQNYVAIRLVMAGTGPLPSLFVERWTVRLGQASRRIRIPLVIAAARDTIFRIGLEVRDQFFTLMIQGKVVDFWSDAEWKSGGVGFFSAAGERALVQALRLTHQYDLIGRACALFLGD